MKIANVSLVKNVAGVAAKCGVLLSLLPGVVAPTLFQAQAQKFTLKHVNPPQATYSYVFGLNNKGQMVGSWESTGQLQGFIFDGFHYKTITAPKSTVTEALGINDSGTVVGDFFGNDQVTHGFVLTHGKFKQYDAGSGVFTWITGVNNAGSFVGYAGWDGANQGLVNIGGKTTLFTVNGNPTIAYGINNKNVVVGFFVDPDLIHSHGFMRTPDGKITQIDDPLGTAVTICVGINDEGAITGSYIDSSNVSHGYKLKNGKFRTYPLPDINGINDKGVFVGSTTSRTGKTQGYIATPVAASAN